MITETVQEKRLASESEAQPRRVCFVCTGNTCRSPMAAAVANAMARKMIGELPEMVRESAVPQVLAYSAGLYACDGEPIATNAVKALELAGVESVPDMDYRCHTAHTLTAEEIEGYDLLVGLNGSHVMELLMRYPQAAQKIVGMPRSISDPYGGDLDVYAACLDEITRGVVELLFSGRTL